MTVKGGGQGHEWDKSVRDGAGAGIVGMVCGGVHSRIGVKWVSGGMQRRGLIRELLCPGPMGDLWPHPHMAGSGGKGNKKEQMSLTRIMDKDQGTSFERRFGPVGCAPGACGEDPRRG